MIEPETSVHGVKIMASSSDDDFVILECTNPNPTDVDARHREVLISTTDIHSWDFHTILRYQTVKIQAYRVRLIEHSSYLHALLSGSFSESCLQCISIRWNLETFLNILKCIHDCPLDLTSDNFLPLFEGALYFGVEMLLQKCKTWFSEVSSPNESGQLQMDLDDLIHIWNFGLEHANDYITELCVSYLARNFMWAISNKFFSYVPYNLLSHCIKHPYLTVDSEMHLSDALLVWLDANTKNLEYLSITEDGCAKLLTQVHLSLLPLWFSAGRRKSFYFSKLADESVRSVFRMMKLPTTGSVKGLRDGDLNCLRIRLTEYSKKVNLSSCPQVTSADILLSLLPPSHITDPILRKSTKQILDNIESICKGQHRISQGLLRTLSFQAVQEVDISKCGRLHLEAAIECFSKSFPSLKIIRAAYLWNFKMTTLPKLVQKCPQVCEIDLTVDISPLKPEVSVISSSVAMTPLVSNKSIVSNNSSDATSIYEYGPSLSNITQLTLEGRSDVYDSDLQYISKVCASLQYLNLRGCKSVTDVCISNLICSCKKLHSIVVCDTSFGMNAVLALCSGNLNSESSLARHLAKRQLGTLASNLQMLHMGGCRDVDEASLLVLLSQTQMLKSLCLRETRLVDEALYNLTCSSLEMFDVSNTMISGASLAHIIHKSPGLKCLNVRGCKNLVQHETDIERTKSLTPYTCQEMFTEIGKTCSLEEISLGWGFSYLCMEALRPAIMSLRKITVGLGGSVGGEALRLLPTTCPILQSVILHFQVISDCILSSLVVSLRQLQALALCYCLGDISISSFRYSMPNLRKLKLERVTPWMTNADLVILIENCLNLVELSLLGCTLLNSDSQQIISHGWPGLISLCLEECGEITANGVSYLFDCPALESLSLHHNGAGLLKNFIFYASSKMPMLRQLSLDLCDAVEGDFDIPDFADRNSLSTVIIARCKSQRCAMNLKFAANHKKSRLVHKETLVLEWNSKNLTRTVVKERLAFNTQIGST